MYFFKLARKISTQLSKQISLKVVYIINFIKGGVNEVQYLKFPSKKETFTYLIIVLLMAFFCSILFFSIDGLSYKIINFIITTLI